MWSIYKQAAWKFIAGLAAGVAVALLALWVTGALSGLSDTQKRGLKAQPYLVCSMQEIHDLLSPEPGKPPKKSTLDPYYEAIYTRLTFNLAMYTQIERDQPTKQRVC